MYRLNEPCFYTHCLVANEVSAMTYKYSPEVLLEKLCAIKCYQNASTRWIRFSVQATVQKTIICNAWSREMMAVRLLIAENAQAIIAGLLVIAYITGAEKAIICINENDTSSEEHISKAISELGLNGAPISKLLPIQVRMVPDRLIVLEETALLNALAGNAPVTYYRGDNDFGFTDGTALVENADTLYTVYRLLADEQSGYSSRHVSIFGSVLKPGIAEVEDSTSFRELLALAGGVAEGRSVKLLLYGGPYGRLVSGNNLDDLLGDYITCKDMQNTQELIIYDDTDCVVDIASKYFHILRTESCGRCVFCREGCRQTAMILEDYTKAEAAVSDIELLDVLSDCAATAAECSFGRSSGRMLKALLENFRTEFDLHAQRRCPASVCIGFISYHILPQVCNGCNFCSTICPKEAIIGEIDEIHVIEKHECNKCGHCMDACPVNAIVKAGAVKPRTPVDPIPVGTWRR